MNKQHLVLPPVRPVGVRCVGLFKNQHQELVHLQQESVGAALREEASQKPVLVLAQSLFVLFWDSNKWILKNTGNEEMNEYPLSHPYWLKCIIKSWISITATINNSIICICMLAAVRCLTLFSRSMFSDLSEASSCHSTTQCFRQHTLRACRPNRERSKLFVQCIKQTHTNLDLVDWQIK